MKIYDLTHYLEKGMTTYSEEEGFNKEVLSSIEEDGYDVSKISLSSHTGTHIDFPKHIFQNGKTLDDFDINKFVGLAYIIDCTKVSDVDLELILNYKEEIYECDYLILKTGYENKWNRESYFSKYPKLSYEASNFLGNIKGLIGIGIDCISIDGEDDKALINHKNLLGNDKLIIENLCGLDNINGKFQIIISPLKIKGGDGSPCRIYGIVK